MRSASRMRCRWFERTSSDQRAAHGERRMQNTRPRHRACARNTLAAGDARPPRSAGGQPLLQGPRGVGAGRRLPHPGRLRVRVCALGGRARARAAGGQPPGAALMSPPRHRCPPLDYHCHCSRWVHGLSKLHEPVRSSVRDILDLLGACPAGQLPLDFSRAPRTD